MKEPFESATSKGLSSPSFIAFFVLLLSIIFFRSLYPPANILSWDVFGYYLYLPARFIYHDIGLHNIDWVKHIAEQYQTTSTLYQVVPSPEGGFVIKYSAGMALLNAPAFILAHVLAGPLGFAADGFSLPYQYAWTITALFITGAGLWFTRKILLEFFNETLTCILMVVIVLATNYFQLTAFDGYLTHNYTYTFCAIITWFTIRWHRSPGYYSSIMLGLSSGLIVLIRPSELVCLFIPLLWNVYSWNSLKEKARLIANNPKFLIIIIIGFIAAGLPQLLYWKHTTGHYIFYSYVNAGEGFDFLNPYTWQVLFSYRKGWFVYTPVMILAIPGFISLYRKNKALFPTIIIYFIVNLFVVSSWTCWWYAGGSYSQRALLTSYILLALPVGYFIEEMFSRKLTRILIITVLVIFTTLNIFQTWQWVHGVINPTRMTKAYYWKVFGRTKIPEGASNLLLVERSDNEVLANPENYESRVLAFHDYEPNHEPKGNYCGDTVYSGHCAMQLDSAKRFTPAIEASFSEITTSDHAWLRISAEVFPIFDPAVNPASLVATFEHEGEAYKYKAEGIELEKYSVKTGVWNKVQFDYLTPEVRSKSDKLKVYFWLRGNQPVLVDDLKVEVFEPR